MRRHPFSHHIFWNCRYHLNVKKKQCISSILNKERAQRCLLVKMFLLLNLFIYLFCAQSVNKKQHTKGSVSFGSQCEGTVCHCEESRTMGGWSGRSPCVHSPESRKRAEGSCRRPKFSHQDLCSTIPCNSSYRGSSTLFWSQLIPTCMWHIHRDTYT